MKERLQKLMSMAGISSRRGAEEMIRAGRVRVNGKVATVGDGADLAVDVVEVDGVKLNSKAMQARVYYAIYKPRNVLASKTERHDDDRKTVYQFVPYKGHLFSIGRLDADSDGLVVLTNDGEMAQKLSHPRYKHTKTYRVVVEGLPTAETIKRWENGIFLEEGKTAPCFVRISKGDPKESVLHIVMTEGKKRQIRRVASILGHPAIRLTRVAIGKLDLGKLKPGEFRVLEPEDIEKLSTPAPELKAIRERRSPAARRPSRGDDSEELTPRGAGRDDDVRSEQQRRSARAGRPDYEDRPRGEGASDRPRRPYARRSDAPPYADRPTRHPRRDDDASPSDRPRRPYARRDDAPPYADRPVRRPRHDDDAPSYADRPPRRPRRDGDATPGDRPRRPAQPRDSGRSSDRPGSRPPSRRPRPGQSSGGSSRPGNRRPPTRRRRDE